MLSALSDGPLPALAAVTQLGFFACFPVSGVASMANQFYTSVCKCLKYLMALK